MNSIQSIAQPLRLQRQSRLRSGVVAVLLSVFLTPLAFADEATSAIPATIPAVSATSAAPTEPATAPLASDPSTPDAAMAAAEQQEVVAAEQALAHDLSPWGMYQNADIVVKLVMIGLALASVATWTIWIGKGFELLRAKRRLYRELRTLKQARTLREAGESANEPGSLAHLLIQDALEEVKLSANTREKEGIKERVSFRLERLVAASGRNMSQGTGVLATIGSTAPFVGLFGTVWGIMNSFIGIAKSQTTNLAVVAPGIAEALLATALGLVAAIPAVVIYNVFARSITGYKAQVADASAQVLLLVSRDLDQLPAERGQSQPHVVKMG
ncbi:tonB-system energizer ExbB [Pseudomonas sp. LS44]|uniref:tonB-system energizer ExbB n=1 Tax=Pseudomonas sp. LS44 TaxID=1357074 RepID=UPI00215B5C6C|nr:tonB-system energizer ExbB [Pseudomonas sp. LS44]UVE17717.1 tonB-system energizer ExbB [Pseudomonas sp. LS44]